MHLAASVSIWARQQECLAVMDRKNIRAMVNLTGGYEKGTRRGRRQNTTAHIQAVSSLSPSPRTSYFKDPNYPQDCRREAIEQAHHDGARGLKILKTLGLYLRENITSGTLVKIDDPRFDPMWDACGATQHAGRDSHLRSRRLLHADRPLQRALMKS